MTKISTPHVYLTEEEKRAMELAHLNGEKAFSTTTDYFELGAARGALRRALADLKAREKEVRQLREALESIRSTADPYAHTGVIMPYIHRTADEALRPKGKGGA